LLGTGWLGRAVAVRELDGRGDVASQSTMPVWCWYSPAERDLLPGRELLPGRPTTTGHLSPGLQLLLNTPTTCR
jgi:hypothetical protein